MKRILLTITCLLVLSSCDKEGGSPTTATSAIPTASIETASPTPSGAPLSEALPDGMDFDFAYNTVYDKQLTTKDGEPRRRVIVEFLEGTAESISESVRNDLVALGYRAGKLREEKGGIRINYARRADGAKVSVLTRPIIDQRVRDPLAKGTVSLSFVPPAESTAGDQSERP